jgi:hypothetical protein
MQAHRIYIVSDSSSLFGGLDTERTCFAIYPDPEDFILGYWLLDNCSLNQFMNTMESLVLENQTQAQDDEF